MLGFLPQFAGWQKDFPKVAEWDRKLNEVESVKCAKAIKAGAGKS